MAAWSEAGRALDSGLLLVGKTIFWADSWLETCPFAYECPHSSRTPATSRTATMTSPPALTSASKVLRRISGASFRHRARGPVIDSDICSFPRSGISSQGRVAPAGKDLGHCGSGPWSEPVPPGTQVSPGTDLGP